MNYADSARIKAVLTNCGWEYTDNKDEANVIIFDTCSVRQKSEDKVTGYLKELSKDQKIWITGCMIQHNLRNSKIKHETKEWTTSELMKKGNFVGNVLTNEPTILGITTDEINEDLYKNKDNKGNIAFINHAFNPTFHNLTLKHPNVELFWRIDDTGFLPLMLKRLGYDISEYDKEITNEYSKIIPEWANQMMDAAAKTAHVPISTGCSQFCSYCIVPYARGLEKNFPVEQVVNEAKHHIEKGAEEIVLIWQIVNKHPDFVTICKEILKIPGLKWLRYTSPYPTYYSDELLELHEKEPKMCPHIHIPFQSGSDPILKKMFRGHTLAQSKEFIDKIRWLDRDISITTDFIVGFCDETQEDFQGTLDLTEYGRFDMIYIGIYSPRPGTYADNKYEDNVPREEKQKRRERLNNVLTQISQENNKKEIGQIKEILVNHIGENNIWWYTDNMKNVLVKTDDVNNIKKGEFIKVKIIDGVPFKLYWEIVK